MSTRSQRPDLLRPIQSLWPSINKSNFYEEEHRRLANSVISTVTGIKTRHHITEADAYEIMTRIAQKPEETLDSMLAIIKQHCGQDLTNHAQREIQKFIIHYWSMMDLDLDDIPGDTPLKSAVTTRLAQRLGSTRNDYPGRLDSELTAASLVRYHDVKIVWTSILEDHLSYDRNQRILKIFEHKIWARNYLTYSDRSVVSVDVLEEVLRTLNLIFPSFNESTESLLEAHGRLESIYGLGPCGPIGSLNLADYRYWRAELEELQDQWNEKPRGLKQFWRPEREGRNLMDLALFWISGVMVFILTVVSSVFGAMSVAYARVQIRQANDAFELAVAQACADPDIGKKLPRYCS